MRDQPPRAPFVPEPATNGARSRSAVAVTSPREPYEPQPVPWLELLEAAQHGDDMALGRLLEALYVRIERLMLRDSSIRAQLAGSTAQDVAAKAIARVAEGIGTCHATTDGAVVTWAYTVARRIAIDEMRSHAARIFALCVADALEDAEAGGLLSVPEDAGPLDSDELALLNAVMKLYDDLSAPAAEVLWRRLTIQESWADTGAALGTSEAGVRRRFQRAIARLRRGILGVLDGLAEDDRAAAVRAIRGRTGITPKGEP